MNRAYRNLASLTLWLGTLAVVFGLIGMVSHKDFVFGLTPRGFLNGAIALLLLSIASRLESREKTV